jgi:hypothetical protein
MTEKDRNTGSVQSQDHWWRRFAEKGNCQRERKRKAQMEINKRNVGANIDDEDQGGDG